VARVRHDRDRVDAVAGVGGNPRHSQVVAGPQLLRIDQTGPPESGLVLRCDVIRGTLLGVTENAFVVSRKLDRRRRAMLREAP
jgi:hypothetical protein